MGEPLTQVLVALDGVKTSAEVPASERSRYRPEIDGLRAFAVAAVIINHFNADLLPNGYLGVDIFFVISGYVITASLSARKLVRNHFLVWLISRFIIYRSTILRNRLRSIPSPILGPWVSKNSFTCCSLAWFGFQGLLGRPSMVLGICFFGFVG